MWKLAILICITFSATLSAETQVLAFAGGLRKDSANKKLVAEAANLARQMGANVTVIDLREYPLPFYDADLEAKEGMPANAQKLRQLMGRSQVILIASPEYNGSLTAVLKNAIDWASRSEKGGSSREAFKGKKFVIMSASPGATGGGRGLVHLRTIIENIGGSVLPGQVVVPDAYNAFDAQGSLKNPQLKKELQELIQQALK